MEEKSPAMWSTYWYIEFEVQSTFKRERKKSFSLETCVECGAHGGAAGAEGSPHRLG